MYRAVKDWFGEKKEEPESPPPRTYDMGRNVLTIALKHKMLDGQDVFEIEFKGRWTSGRYDFFFDSKESVAAWFKSCKSGLARVANGVYIPVSDILSVTNTRYKHIVPAELRDET